MVTGPLAIPTESCRRFVTCVPRDWTAQLAFALPRLSFPVPPLSFRASRPVVGAGWSSPDLRMAANFRHGSEMPANRCIQMDAKYGCRGTRTGQGVIRRGAWSNSWLASVCAHTHAGRVHDRQEHLIATPVIRLVRIA